MSAYLSWEGGELLFDLTVNEQHEKTVQITTFPVEEGSDINDHVRATPRTVTLDMFISNAPLYALGRGGGQQRTIPIEAPVYQAPFALTPGAVFSAAGGAVHSLVDAIVGNSPKSYAADVLAFDSPFDAVADALDTLDRLQGDQDSKTPATLVDVTTSKRTYTGMILENYKLTRGASEGTGAKVTLSFRKLRTVTTKLVGTPTPAEARGQKAKSTGKKGGKDAKDPTKKKSVLVALIDQGKRFFQ
jgi:hypothetical protein